MEQLMMQGFAITGAERFKKYFCPKTLLRKRELAAGFLYQHFRYLSDVELFHADVFYEMALGEPESFEIWQEYTQCLCGQMALNYRKQQQVKLLLNGKASQERMRQLWRLSRDTELEGTDRHRLYALLVAGYSLAEKDLESCPLSPEEAREAYLRTEKEDRKEKYWLEIPQTGVISLKARETPYRILLEKGAKEWLEKGETITFRKFVALQHEQGDTSVPVTLQLYASAEDPNPREVVFFAGDYRYANFVKNIPVHFHPVARNSQTTQVERRGNKLRFLYKKSNFHSGDLDCSKLEVVGFAAEEKAEGWLMLTDQSLINYYYSAKLATALPEASIVEAAFWGTECLLLDKFGRVYSSHEHGIIPDVRISTLGEFRR